jgi:cobalamin synthase
MDGMRGRYMLEATALAVVSLGVPALMLDGLRTASWHMGLAVAMLVTYALVRMLTSFCRNGFGGHTGDTLGATGELAEIIFLLVVLTWQRLYI